MVWVNSVAFCDECGSAIKRGPVLLLLLDSRDYQLEGGGSDQEMKYKYLKSTQDQGRPESLIVEFNTNISTSFQRLTHG